MTARADSVFLLSSARIGIHLILTIDLLRTWRDLAIAKGDLQMDKHKLKQEKQLKSQGLKPFVSSRRWSKTALKLSFKDTAEASSLLAVETQECKPGGVIKWYPVNLVPGTVFEGRLERIKFEGGHRHHDSNSPTGSLVPQRITFTGGSVPVIEFRAPEVSGLIAAHWFANGVHTETDFNRVRVPDLVPLQSRNSLVLIGATTEHPQNHYGHPALNIGLARLGDAFFARYRVPLQVNDMSLPWGGLFDLGRSGWWRSPHAEHRDGRQADIRSTNMTPDQKMYFGNQARIFGFSVLVETTRHTFTLELRQATRC